MKKLALVAVLLLLLTSPAWAQQFSSIDVPAVDEDGAGIMTVIEVEVVPGRGRILVNSAPLVGLETQDSERVAIDIASEYTGFDFSESDVIFSVISNASVVEGPSAGAAMAVATIATLQGMPVRDDAVITGTIQVDGSISEVGEIIKKGEAAAAANKTLYLIPAGQGSYPLVVPVTEEVYPGWEVTRQTVAYVDVAEYARDQWNMTVIEVPNIYEAVRILVYGYNNLSMPFEAEVESVYSGDRPAVPPQIEPMEALADEEIQRAVEMLALAQAELTLSSLEPSMAESLQGMLDYAQEDLETARNARLMGVLYGAANFAFKSRTSSRTVLDMVIYESFASGEEKVEYLGDRIVEADSTLSYTEEKLGDVQDYVNDQGSYEWAVGAEQRLTQAQERFERHPDEASEIFYDLALVEEWSRIAELMYDISVEKSTGKYIDTSAYKNQSEDVILRAAAELDHYEMSSPFGPKWYAEVAAREYNNKWYLTSYLDASITVNRIESGIELNTRSWEDLVVYITAEVQEVETYDTVWGTLYKDYAEFTLSYAVSHQDKEFLKEALRYARQAELFAETAEDIRYLPVEPKPLIEDIPDEDIFWLAVLSIVIMFTGIFLGYAVYRTKRKHK